MSGPRSDEISSASEGIRTEFYYSEAGRANEGSVQIGLLGLKSLLVANGGALIGMLTFVGNYEQFPGVTRELWSSFLFFFFGLFIALCAIIFGYFTQLQVVKGYIHCGEYLIAARSPDQVQRAQKFENIIDLANRRAGQLRIAAVICALASLTLFGLGGWFGVEALESATAPTLNSQGGE